MDFDKYENRFKRVTIREDSDIPLWLQWKNEKERLHNLFKEDALRDVGLEGHPRADKAFQLAWREGHSDGFFEVHDWLLDLAELLI